MAFARRGKNRRKQPGSPIEVRLRTGPRRRRLRFLFVLLCFSGLAAYGLHHAARYWPEFRDRKLLGEGLFALEDVQTFGPFVAVSRAELLLRAGVRPGQNLLALDLGRIKRDVETIPYVDSAAVERILPHLLRLRIMERTPVARVRVFSVVDDSAAAGTVYYLDRHGAVMPSTFNITPPGDPFADRVLPLITGVSAMDLRPGDRATDPAVRWALELVGLYELVPVNALARLKSVDVSEPGTLRATLGNSARVTFGPNDVERQLMRLGLLHEVGAEHGQRLLEVDLSVENNCPSLWTPLVTADALAPSRRTSSTLLPNDV